MVVRLWVAPEARASAETLATRWGLQVEVIEDRRAAVKAAVKAQRSTSDAANETPPWGLWYDQDGLALQAYELPVPAPIRADFQGGALGWRTQSSRPLAGEAVVRACQLKARQEALGRAPVVWDLTAGLGRDGWILAHAGARVRLVERHPMILALLMQAHHAASQDPERAATAARLTVEGGDALAVLRAVDADTVRPDIIYLDPMFPHREASALVKLDMRLFRAVVGTDDDADTLLDAARRVARTWVVVKRPRLAPDLADCPPDDRLIGQANRFDRYRAFD